MSGFLKVIKEYFKQEIGQNCLTWTCAPWNYKIGDTYENWDGPYRITSIVPNGNLGEWNIYGVKIDPLDEMLKTVKK